MGLEGRSFRHHGADDKTFDVLRLHPGHRIEARLAGLPDEVAVARLAHAELRDPRADERHPSHVARPCAPASSVSTIAACPARRAAYAGVCPSWFRLTDASA